MRHATQERVVPSPEVDAAKTALLDAVSTLRRGRALKNDGQKKKELMKLAEKLRSATEASESSYTAGDVNGVWRLLFTTEAETLFILEKFPSSGELGPLENDVFQVIDLTKGSLFNVIEFGRGRSRAFIVGADIALDESIVNATEKQGEALQANITPSCRIRFKFRDARLKWSDSTSIPVPPFGQGWFDSIYIDDTIRVALDSRGDLLIVERSDVVWET